MLHTIDHGTGTPLLWIHGFPLSSRVFARQLEIPGVRHLLLDLPGFGASRPVEEATIDDYARMAVKALDGCGVERAIFAGLSMGGYICLAAARLAPERMSGLILIDTRETADTDEGRRGRYASIEKVRSEGVQPIVEAMLPKMLTPRAPAEMVADVRAVMESSTPDGVIVALRAMAERPDSAPLLPSISVPALIVVGEDDTITPPADAERMRAAIPAAELVRLAGAAHLSNVERAGAFNDAVRSFVG